tara:strand:- start:18072 stop:18488 length:417 start_codon:yes stop_codon:yes gene_type:complete
MDFTSQLYERLFRPGGLFIRSLTERLEVPNDLFSKPLLISVTMFALPSLWSSPVKKGNLHRLYKRKALGRAQSEEVLDTLKLYVEAGKVLGDRDSAQEWLHSEVRALNGSQPIDIFDNFAGREMVRDVLGKIEFGEFS